MNEKDVFKKLIREYPELIINEYPFPKPFGGHEKIKAIVLGADPTHIVNSKPVLITTVFDINDKGSATYWDEIEKNIKSIGLSRKYIYVQNVCRNYFKEETSNNKKWVKIAREYWLPLLKHELDNMFSPQIPILITTEFILNSSLIDEKEKINAIDIYEKCFTIPREKNLLNREIIALYCHVEYSLDKIEWAKYKRFVTAVFN